MKEIIALQEYTDKYISLYEGQIRNIEDNIANKLIEKGIVAEHSDSGSGSGSGDQTGGSGIQIVNLVYNEDDGVFVLDGDEATIRTQLTQGAFVIFKTPDNEWFYPTAISNGWLLLISYMAYKGTGYFRTLSSDGYGAFTEHNYQLS